MSSPYDSGYSGYRILTVQGGITKKTPSQERVAQGHAIGEPSRRLASCIKPGQSAIGEPSRVLAACIMKGSSLGEELSTPVSKSAPAQNSGHAPEATDKHVLLEAEKAFILESLTSEVQVFFPWLNPSQVANIVNIMTYKSLYIEGDAVVYKLDDNQIHQIAIRVADKLGYPTTHAVIENAPVSAEAKQAVSLPFEHAILNGLTDAEAQRVCTELRSSIGLENLPYFFGMMDAYLSGHDKIDKGFKILLDRDKTTRGVDLSLIRRIMRSARTMGLLTEGSVSGTDAFNRKPWYNPAEFQMPGEKADASKTPAPGDILVHQQFLKYYAGKL